MAARASVGASLSNKNFDDRHQEYLRKLQARNLQQRLAREAEEQRNADRLRREQGFSVYISGANQRRSASLERQRSPSFDAGDRNAARQWEENTVEIRGLGGEVHALRPSGERRFLPPRLPAIPAAAGLILGSSSTSVATLKQTAGCTLRSPSSPARFGDVMRLDSELGEPTMRCSASGAYPQSREVAILTATQRELQGLLPSLVSAGVVGAMEGDRPHSAASGGGGLFSPPARSEADAGDLDDRTLYDASPDVTSNIQESAVAEVEQLRTPRSARELLDAIPSPLQSPLDKDVLEFTADEYDAADVSVAPDNLEDERDTSTGCSECSEVSERLATTGQLAEDLPVPLESEEEEEEDEADTCEPPEPLEMSQEISCPSASPLEATSIEPTKVEDDAAENDEAAAPEADADNGEALHVNQSEALTAEEGDNDCVEVQHPDHDGASMVEEEELTHRICKLTPEWKAAILKLLKEAENGGPAPTTSNPAS